MVPRSTFLVFYKYESHDRILLRSNYIILIFVLSNHKFCCEYQLKCFDLESLELNVG